MDDRRRRVSRPHRQQPEDLEPAKLAQRIDSLPLRELEHLARQLLSRLALTAEAPGMRIAQDIVHSGKASGSAPRSTPLCTCGCPSRRDHWECEFNRALRLDADQGGDWEPRRFRGAILRCSYDLDAASHTQRRPTDAREVEQPHERDERIVQDYEGLPADVAASLESHRSGHHLTAEALRRTRRRNGRHPADGREAPPAEEIRQRVLELSWSGLTQSRIAMEIGVAQSTVSRYLSGHTQQLESGAAA